MPIPPIIPPSYIIPQGAGICQVFLQKYFKKIKQKTIDFCPKIWYNIYRKDEKRKEFKVKQKFYSKNKKNSWLLLPSVI